MFRLNPRTHQPALLSDLNLLLALQRERLEPSWAGTFRREVFERLDERAFAGLYVEVAQRVHRMLTEAEWARVFSEQFQPIAAADPTASSLASSARPSVPCVSSVRRARKSRKPDPPPDPPRANLHGHRPRWPWALGC